MLPIGTRQAYLPHSIRTGPPGRWTRGGAYRLLDEKVRVFVAPPLEELNNTDVRLTLRSIPQPQLTAVLHM